MKYLVHLIGRFFVYVVLVPLLIAAIGFTAMFIHSDIKTYDNTMQQLRSMQPTERFGAEAWQSGAHIFIRGHLSGNPIISPLLMNTPQLANCLGIRIKVETKDFRNRWETKIRETLVAPNAHIGNLAIDELFLKNLANDAKRQTYGTDTPIGQLCREQSNTECKVELACVLPQEMSLFGMLNHDLSTRQLDIPKSLDRGHAFAQQGTLTPETYTVRFAAAFKNGTLIVWQFVMAAVVVQLFTTRKRSFKAFIVILLAAAVSLAPYQLLDNKPMAILALVAFIVAALATGIWLLFSLKPYGYEEGAVAPAPVKPTAKAPVTIAPPKPEYDDLVAPALTHLSVRLSAATLNVLTPEQLQRSVRMYYEDHPTPRYTNLSTLEKEQLYSETALRLKGGQPKRR